MQDQPLNWHCYDTLITTAAKLIQSRHATNSSFVITWAECLFQNVA